MAEGVISRDVNAAFVSEDASFDLPVSESGVEGERDILMHGLECLEDERVTGGCGFDTVGEGGVDEVNKKGRWEEGDIIVVGTIRGKKVGSVGESVRAGKQFPGNVDHFKIVVGEVNEPSCLLVI